MCGASDITLAWLFRAVVPPPPTPERPNGGGTQGFPSPGGRAHLVFPLAMGHFLETAGVLPTVSSYFSSSASISSVHLPTTASSTRSLTAVPSHPALACDPCSVFYARDGALAYGITVALPLVRYAENRQAIHAALDTAFDSRFSDASLPQVFLSVLLLSDHAPGPPRARSPVPSFRGGLLRLIRNIRIRPEPAFDIEVAGAAAAAANTYHAAVEWTVRDLLHAIPVRRGLSESFSLPRVATDGSLADSPPPPPPPIWPLGAVLADAFERLDIADDTPTPSTAEGIEGVANASRGRPPRSRVNGRALAAAAPLLQNPLPGFIAMLRAVALGTVGSARSNDNAPPSADSCSYCAKSWRGRSAAWCRSTAATPHASSRASSGSLPPPFQYRRPLRRGKASRLARTIAARRQRASQPAASP